jgi:hypothetical protein
MMNKKPAYGIDKVLSEFKATTIDSSQDMSLEEAATTVLGLARTLEWRDDFEWELEHQEACGIIDRLFFSGDRVDG